MRKDKRRLLLLTQDRRLLEDSKAALENESRHLVEVARYRNVTADAGPWRGSCNH